MWHAVSVRSLRVAQDRLFAALRTTTGWHRPLPATYEQEREPGIAALGGASLTPTHLAGRGVACGALACPTQRSTRVVGRIDRNTPNSRQLPIQRVEATVSRSARSRPRSRRARIGPGYEITAANHVVRSRSAGRWQEGGPTPGASPSTRRVDDPGRRCYKRCSHTIGARPAHARLSRPLADPSRPKGRSAP